MTRHDMNLPRTGISLPSQHERAVSPYRFIEQLDRDDGGDSVNVWSHEVTTPISVSLFLQATRKTLTVTSRINMIGQLRNGDFESRLNSTHHLLVCLR